MKSRAQKAISTLKKMRDEPAEIQWPKKRRAAAELCLSRRPEKFTL
jgi:hypothetical protein